MSEEELTATLEFLQKNHHNYGWDEEALDTCHTVFFTQGEEVAALIWLDTGEYQGNTWLQAHICVDTEHRCRWALRYELEALFSLRYLITPKPYGVVAEVYTLNLYKLLYVMGFDFHPDLPFAYIIFEDNQDGKEETACSRCE